jgi:capsular polysaccharide transport system ATP-binding protein
MIELANVTFRTRQTLSPVVFEDVNLRIEDGERVAFLAPDKRFGLSVLQDLFCDANAPDRGRVIRTGSLSWPIPDASFFHQHLSFVANARFIARMYGLDTRLFVPRVCEMAGVTDIMDERLDHCPKSAVSPFTFSLGVCVPFDTYLLTTAVAGKGEDGAALQQELLELSSRCGIIVVAMNGKGVADLCDRAYVLDNGSAKIVPYDDIEEALDHLKRLASKAAEDEDFIKEVPEEELRNDFF